MDVKIAFLNGILKEEVYVGQPLGFVSKQYPNHVYALDKALYGLKQAPRAWYDVLSKFLIDSGFQKGSIDPTLFIKIKDFMVKRFGMSMMGEMKFFLGLQVNQFSNRILINQSKYILDILKRFRMENCDTVPTPMVEQAKLKLDLDGKPVDHTDYHSIIGSLMYLTSSRPDIMFATCLWYLKDSGFDLTAYSDADHVGCHLDRKKSEYVDVSGCCAQVLWMRPQLIDYGFFYDKVPIYWNSQSAIAISCNPVQHTRTKHIDVSVNSASQFARRGNEPDLHDVKITSLKQWIQELEFPQLQQDSPAEEAKIESNVWDDGSEDVNPFGGGNPGFHDDHFDNPLLTKETEPEPIIWDIRDEKEEYPFEEEGFVGKGGFGGEEDNIEDVVVVANDLCSSMIQTILSVDFEEDINTKSHELMSFGKRDTNLDATSTRDE
ncbi:retrovirus-related pol polyprotein from transposon TNT 1-94 [Tanacetum coccineum]|uniref:Retrovirus-related pol polyprotein from transposon TNT 1-94 n=1 Tax=Tanacetum coccineum TaxID=301880 RepID=A0ABQ5JES6_9ASTR